ncbi:MAG: hypothetical protein Q7V58_06950 [Actinomycetota bacterium]|nr:hypothetical protein [Actinomycetota bacterium]
MPSPVGSAAASAGIALILAIAAPSIASEPSAGVAGPGYRDLGFASAGIARIEVPRGSKAVDIE